MSRAIMNRTLITVTVQLETNTRALELLLIWLSMAWWHLRRVVNRARYEWAMFQQDFSEATTVTIKLWVIVFNSWAWALGVKV